MTFCRPFRTSLTALALAVLLLLPRSPGAAEALVAVATNFAEAAEALAAEVEAATGHEITLSAGSTGKLAAQIGNGAPFDLFLSADEAHPRLLAETGAGVPETRRTYATGALVLWSADPALITGDGAAVLRNGGFRALAIANPELAPYGKASLEVLEKLEVYGTLKGRLVIGQNIGQAFALVATGNAEIGLVARALVESPRNPAPGSGWSVPPELHAPIRQDAILLTRGRDNPAARAFLDHLLGPKGRETIRRFGYGVD